MTAPTRRLVRRIQEDFGSRADEVTSRLGTLVDASQTERVQAAIIVRAAGDFSRFLSEMDLAQLDWRDTLVGSGFEHADYEEQLDRVLGPS